MVVGMEGRGWKGREGEEGVGVGVELRTLCAAAQTALECFPECTEALAGTETPGVGERRELYLHAALLPLTGTICIQTWEAARLILTFH